MALSILPIIEKVLFKKANKNETVTNSPENKNIAQEISLIIIMLSDSVVNNNYHLNDINTKHWHNEKLRYTILAGWGDGNCIWEQSP